MLLREHPVAALAGQHMGAHCLAGAFGILIGDCREDLDMFGINLLKIAAVIGLRQRWKLAAGMALGPKWRRTST